MSVDHERMLSVNAEKAFAALRPGHDSTGHSRASPLMKHHSGSHLKAKRHHSVPVRGCDEPPPSDPYLGHRIKAGARLGAGPPRPSLAASQAALPSVASVPDQILSPVLAFEFGVLLHHLAVILNLPQPLHPPVIFALPCPPPVGPPCPLSPLTCGQEASHRSSWVRPVSGCWLAGQAGHWERNWCSGKENYRAGPSWAG